MAAGGGEAIPGGKELGQVRQVPPTSLGQGTYQTSTPTWCLTLLSKRMWSDTGCIETFPSSGWGLQKLEEPWNVQSSNSAPALASALLAQPLCNLPTYSASVYVLQRLKPPHPSQLSAHKCGLPSASPSSFGDPKSDHQHKFLYWCSFCPSPEKDF